jgi:hypothetical protein
LVVDEQHYEVALWRAWPSLFPEHVDTLWASDYLKAIEWVMRLREVRFVAHVAVALCGAGGPARYERVCLAADGLCISSVHVAA